MIYYIDLLIFPNKINNLIYAFLGKNYIGNMIKDMVEDKYENDFHPYFIKSHLDFYKFKYSFYEWYFITRIKLNYCNKKKRKYKHTPGNLQVGYDKVSYKY